jgi:hypothetical protein
VVLLWGETTGRWKLGRRRGETVALSAPAVSAVQTGRLLAEVIGQDLGHSVAQLDVHHARGGGRREFSGAQLGKQLRPVGQLLFDHWVEHRLVDASVHLVPVDTAERWVRVVLDRQLDHSGGRLVGEAGG